MRKPILFALVIIGLILAGLLAIIIVRRAPLRTYLKSIESPTAATSGDMIKYEVKNATEREAVCNDGSSAVYYYRAGSGENIDKWVIHLEGGGGCASVEECSERWTEQRNRMSSKNYADSLQGIGIFSINERRNPDFFNFNHVFIKYCSSDFWSGDNEVDIGEINMLMKGQFIVDAMLEDLQDPEIIPGHNLSEATEVLFTGSSAGAYGVMRNLDHVAETLSWAKVRGVNDSGWNMLRRLAEEEGVIAEPEVAEAVHDFYNPRLDESCLADHADEELLCGASDIVAEYTETPFFLYVDQLDHLVLDNEKLNSQEESEQARLKERYAELVRESVKDMDGVFSTRIGQHTALRSIMFTTMKIDGYTYQEVLGNWYFDREGPKNVVKQ